MKFCHICKYFDQIKNPIPLGQWKKLILFCSWGTDKYFFNLPWDKYFFIFVLFSIRVTYFYFVFFNYIFLKIQLYWYNLKNKNPILWDTKEWKKRILFLYSTIDMSMCCNLDIDRSLCSFFRTNQMTIKTLWSVANYERIQN